MLFTSIVNRLFTLVRFIFGFVYLPSFDLSAFDTYLTWFNGLLDSATSLIAFLIPRPVFYTSIAIALFIHEWDTIIMILKWVLGFVPFIGNGVNRK